MENRRDRVSIASNDGLMPLKVLDSCFSRPVRTSSQPVDLETPRVKEKPQANVVLHNDRLHDFTERSTPSLANDSAFVGEPVTFKKRKLGGDHRKNVRRRNDDD